MSVSRRVDPIHKTWLPRSRNTCQPGREQVADYAPAWLATASSRQLAEWKYHHAWLFSIGELQTI